MLHFIALNVIKLPEREPIIYHGFTLTTKLPFRDVIHTIRVILFFNLYCPESDYHAYYLTTPGTGLCLSFFTISSCHFHREPLQQSTPG